MTRLLGALAVVCLMMTGAAHARPVSYQDGYTVIQETDRQSTALWLHYTITPKLSLGYRGEWDRWMDVVFNGAQATFLAKRWFGENYQANIYGFTGVGVAFGVDDNDAKPTGAAFIGAMADWETRRWFLSYRVRSFEAGAVDSSIVQAARVGFAPYEGDMGDLHTWLMVEVDYRPENEDPIGVTPLVRFFKGTALLEVGWSVLDDRPLANAAYRF